MYLTVEDLTEGLKHLESLKNNDITLSPSIDVIIKEFKAKIEAIENEVPNKYDTGGIEGIRISKKELYNALEDRFIAIKFIEALGDNINAKNVWDDLIGNSPYKEQDYYIFSVKECSLRDIIGLLLKTNSTFIYKLYNGVVFTSDNLR